MSLFTNNVAQEALTLIRQHIHDCEIRANQAISRTVGLETKMDEQDDMTKAMHQANLERFAKLDKDANDRFSKLMFVLLSSLLAALAAFGFEILKAHHGS